MRRSWPWGLSGPAVALIFLVVVGSVGRSSACDGITDARLFLVPAADHPANSTRPIFDAPESYPRYVGSARGANNYQAVDGQQDSTPRGYIPQVPHTYALMEATYGVMNEHGVGIAESTCSCIDWSKIPSAAHLVGRAKPLMAIDTLSRIGLERATTARETVQIMGALAEAHGFYGPDSFEGTGETLLVEDGNESFVFHILGDPTGSSAVWVAQRVPDGHVAVCANLYIVREVDLNDPSQFLYSQSMVSLAQEHGLWTPGTPFDFAGIYSDGEYAHKYYSGRRMWGAYHLLAPSLNLNASYDNLLHDRPYPFSVRPDRLLNVSDFFRVHRYSYEDTPYSLRQGIAAGAFGTPDRYSGGAGEAEVQGNWERPISLFRTTYSHVIQSHRDLPAAVRGTLFFGPHAAHGTCYLPLFSGQTEMAEAYRQARAGKLNRTSAFWAFRYVENLANLRFDAMIQDINAQQRTYEAEGVALRAQLVAAAQAGHVDVANLTTASLALTQRVVAKWWELADDLMVKYADGWVTVNLGPVDAAAPPGYPAWWLKQVGYPEGPPPVDAVHDNLDLGQK
ncbi:uncharacterized protein MONBRDRAFT_25939 [Monosiga brevicollis MX1]|uniref:Dipeptidase n=1 Tax=Monosiga brevicollis TaxID=81824 RepID=A9V0X1_MONBE|nr:uncharacterized protein MONBRDRAFT_25939 [Monosiga brevicollis MX1]EDQ88830.1 predicted protein [Monosiga brevicollis MX1]|eukprot:XP_001746443.1 hypothetical protein [Monosiga brevicollis MX1]